MHAIIITTNRGSLHYVAPTPSVGLILGIFTVGSFPAAPPVLVLVVLSTTYRIGFRSAFLVVLALVFAITVSVTMIPTMC